MRTRDSTTVEITVEGHLDSRWGPAFEGMDLIQRDNGTTVIHGPVPDQAGLHGLLRRVRDSGMALLTVNTWRNEMNTQSNGEARNIVVFGATGRSGSAVVRRALERGHSVTAFVRNPGKVTVSDPKLRTVTGDVDRKSVV